MPYLIQESVLFLVFSYLMVIGGTYNGAVLLPLWQVHLAGGGLAGMVWLGWRLRTRRPFPATPMDGPLMVWLGVTLASSLFSANPRLSLEYFNLQLVYVLAYYLVVDLMRAGWAEELWVKTLLLAGMVVLGMGLVQIGYWYGDWFRIGGWEELIPQATIRINAYTHINNLLAAFLNLLMPMALSVLVTAKKKVFRIGLGLWVGISLALVYFTSSRGGWLGTFSALATFAVLWALDYRDLLGRVWRWLRQHKTVLAGLAAGVVAFAALAGVLLAWQSNHPTHPSGGDPRSYIWRVAGDMVRSRPLLGTGPGTFGLFFMERYSIPPDMLLTNAHNFPLNILGETGLLGGASVLVLGGMLVWTLLRRWRATPPGQRAMLMGISASLVGVSVHGIFDVPEYFIVNSLIIAILLGLLVAKAPLMQSAPGRTSGWGSVALLAGGLASILYTGWMLYGYAAYEQGVTAARQSEWGLAAQWMEQAVQRDPANRFYRFQKGFAYGEVALNADGSVRDRAALETARADYEEGLAGEPEYALHWANLAILRRAGGDLAGAVEAMEEAGKRAQSSSVLRFNLGRLYEESGQTDQAVDAYQTAILNEPVWKDSVFREGSPAWRSALERSGESLVEHPGWQALEERRYLDAESIFRARLGVNAADEYRGLGMALVGLGRIQEADHAFSVAAFIDGAPLSTRLRMGKLYQDMGEVERARAEYADARLLLEHYSTYGPGIWDGGRYAWLIYRRVGFEGDLLPGWTPNYHPAAALP